MIPLTSIRFKNVESGRVRSENDADSGIEMSRRFSTGSSIDSSASTNNPMPCLDNLILDLNESMYTRVNHPKIYTPNFAIYKYNTIM